MDTANKNSTYTERRAQKIAARDSESRTLRRKNFFKKISYWFFGVVVILGGGWFLITRLSPKGSDFSAAVEILGRNHIPDGSTAAYNSNPPTSGDHYAVPASIRFYDKELPDEQLVHNLEHGHVWIAYKPGLSSDILSIFRDFSGGNIVVALRSKNDTDIALAAWGRLDKFNIEANGIDKQRVKDFISRYQNRGPENVNRPNHLR